MSTERPVTTAEALIRRLEAHGVRHVFGIPGTHNLPLYRHLAESSMQHVTPRHEQGAAYAADGYARASGRPAVCLVTTGPALLNAATAAAQAYADSVPMLIVSPAMPTDVDGRDTGYLHELKDQHGVMDRLVARSDRVFSPADAVAAIDRAFADFASGRPRPVHVEIPLDAMEREGSPNAGPPALPARPTGDAGQVREAARLLAEARSPALVLGGGAVDSSAAALDLARATGAAVVTTINGKGIVPEDDPLSLGSSIRLDACKQFLRGCDVVLAAGTELAESDLWEAPPLALDGKLIRVDIDRGQIHKNATAALGIVADASAVLGALAAAVGGGEQPPQPSLGATRSAIAQEALVDGAPFAPLVDALGEALPDDGVVAGDSAQVCYYGIAHLLTARRPRGFLYPTGLATLGCGLPAAVGAKLALPERAVVAVVGDGGLMFTLPELATAVEQRLGLPIVVVDNGGYGEIRRQMVERGIPPLGVDFGAPDFAAVARAFGARGHTVSEAAGLAPVISEALAADTPTLIHVRAS